MLIEFCLPKSGKAVPSGPDWLHEVKYDGYRLRLERDGDRVRLFSRGGHDWGTLDRRGCLQPLLTGLCLAVRTAPLTYGSRTYTC
jgi:ATP dependent DNA ligase domain